MSALKLWQGDFDPTIKTKFDSIKDQLLMVKNVICKKCGTKTETSQPSFTCPGCGFEGSVK